MSAGAVQSVGRAMAILRSVARAGDEGLRLSDVAAQIGLHKASASRLLNSLVDEAVLRRDEDRRFRVHPSFRGLFGPPVSAHQLRLTARPSLSRLVEVLGEVAFLSVRSGYDSLCIDRQVGWYPIQALSLDVGSRRPLGVGAGSLVLLAWSETYEIERALEATAQRRIAYPAYSEDRLRELTAIARLEGFAEVRDLVVPGMTGIGVPLFDDEGLLIGALSVAALSQRLADERRALAINILKDCRADIENEIRAGAAAEDEEALVAQTAHPPTH